MSPHYSSTYLERLLSSAAYEDLVEVSSLLCATERFSPTENSYGLPQPLFVFVEGLLWAAQSSRSGAQAYYEATPRARQEAMLRGMQAIAEPTLAPRYAEGMANWRDARMTPALDAWIQERDRDITLWLFELLHTHRAIVHELLG
jgi:hypothetical protein